MTRPILIAALVVVAACGVESPTPVDRDRSTDQFRVVVQKPKTVQNMAIGETARVTAFYDDNGRIFVWPHLELNGRYDHDIITRYSDGWVIRFIEGHQSSYGPPRDAIFPRIELPEIEAQVKR